MEALAKDQRTCENCGVGPADCEDNEQWLECAESIEARADEIIDALRSQLRHAEERAEKAEEELAHVRRELVESMGGEETSQTLAIYESFKAALEPFGHKNINVRGRIERLVEEWNVLRKRVEKVDGEREALRAVIEHNHTIQYLSRMEPMCQCDPSVGMSPCLDCATRQAALAFARALAALEGE